MLFEGVKESSKLRVKLCSGASIVNVRPLFTHDSKNIIFASGCDVKVYSIQSGECVHILEFHQARIICLQENKENQLQFFSCSKDGLVVRWDLTEGAILEKYDLLNPVTNFFVLGNDWFIVKESSNPGDFCLFKLKKGNKPTEKIVLKTIMNSVSPDQNTVSFGFENKVIAAAYGNSLKIYNCETAKFKEHLVGERKLVCVRCHQSDCVVAAGDDWGRIYIWSNFLETNHPVRTVYHWHSLPPSDLAFSVEGTYLYSAGGESTLVKWNLFSGERSFIPRLGAPILRISVSPENLFVVIAQNDNSLQLINSQKNIVRVIQGLTLGHFQGARGKDLLPTGLLYDPQTKALVMNGRPGHLQFYDILEDSQMFNLDISGRSFVSGGNSWETSSDSTVINTDVQRAAIDSNGDWLASAEYWDDEETSPQIWLKFWKFDASKQTFSLNTNVILPHNKAVNCIIFRPVNDFDSLPFAVTTSADKSFKTWVLKDDSSLGDEPNWSCLSMGCYRDLVPTGGCFSEDGSLLAVAFGSVSTLWTADGAILKAALSHEEHDRPISQLVFGRQSSSHLLVCHDKCSLTTWNVLTLSIHWIVHVNVQTLAAELRSDVMAAFCEDQTLIIFKPSHPEPVSCLENVSETPVVSAIFIPSTQRSDDNDKCSHTESQLFFFNESQNLLTLTHQPVINNNADLKDKVLFQKNIPKTPFGMLQPEFKVSHVKQESEQEHLVLGSTADNQNMIEITCPTLVNPLTLCPQVLKSLLIPVKKFDVDKLEIKGEPTDAFDLNPAEVLRVEHARDELCRVTDFSFLVETVGSSVN